MFKLGHRATALFLALLLMTVGASADDWVAQKLRGGVFTLIGGTWVQLERGDVVPDRQVVRTQNNGRVSLVRGAETVDVGPNSQVEIVDKDGQQFTTVKQSYGTVEIEAEVRNVQHVAVVNQHLVAVVKGTRFMVKSNDAKASVEVDRGQVSVKDSVTNETVQVAAGHSVTTSADAALVMDGGTAAATPASRNLAANTSGQGGVATDGGNGNSNDNNGSGPGNNGNGNAYGHDNGGGNGNGNANGHNQ
jgi:ferric-dicitrate binding protein FerR (iron transport regulator)